MFIFYIENTKLFFWICNTFFVGLDQLLKHFFKLLYKPTLNKVDLLTYIKEGKYFCFKRGLKIHLYIFQSNQLTTILQVKKTFFSTLPYLYRPMVAKCDNLIKYERKKIFGPKIGVISP